MSGATKTEARRCGSMHDPDPPGRAGVDAEHGHRRSEDRRRLLVVGAPGRRTVPRSPLVAASMRAVMRSLIGGSAASGHQRTSLDSSSATWASPSSQVQAKVRSR